MLNISDSEVEKDSKHGSDKKILSFHEISIALSKEDTKINKPITWFGILVLMSAVIGGASMPPFINLYGDISTFTKNLWRWQMNFIISIPFVIHSVYTQPEAIDMPFIFSLKGTAYLMLSGVIFTGACGTFIASAWLTITSHTLILGSLAGVIIIIYKFVFCQELHNLEKYGTIAVVIGSVLLINDPNAEKTGDQEVTIMGEVFAIMSSWCYALFFPLNKIIIKRVPGIIIFMYTAMSSLLCFLIINILIEGIEPSTFFSFDPRVGFFGWISEKQWMISIFLVAPFWGFCGNGGYIFSLKYFEPHIVGNALLLEPVIGQLLGCLLGQDKLPGILTFVGAAIILSGIYTVAQGTKKLSEEPEIQIANDDHLLKDDST